MKHAARKLPQRGVRFSASGDGKRPLRKKTVAEEKKCSKDKKRTNWHAIAMLLILGVLNIWMLAGVLMNNNIMPYVDFGYSWLAGLFGLL